MTLLMAFSSFLRLLLDIGSKNIEFNWRHDWNSLISHNESLVMTRYSELYFPHADDLVSGVSSLFLVIED